MNPTEFENILIKLIFDKEKAREKVVPFLSPDIFDDFNNIAIVKFVNSFIEEYDKFPTVSEMKIYVPAESSQVYEKLVEVMKIDLSEYDEAFLLSEVEQFFREKLVMNCATSTATHVRDGKLDKVSTMPELIREALSFSFNTEVGLDLLNSAERLYNHLHNRDKIIPSGVECFDKLVGGGFHEKSLSLFLAETNLGKSLIMSSLAVNALLQNKNVLYVSCEMSEDKISERMVSNLFDIEIETLAAISLPKFLEKFSKIRNVLAERLFIKEYPPRTISVSHIRNLIKELKNKKKFVPDIIFIDYLGIILPISVRKGDNTYLEVKRISEEVRSLAVEMVLPIVSAIQTNRGGFGDVEIDLTDISDSIGTAATADVIIGVTQSDDYRDAGKYSWIILKNRYGLNKKKTTVNVDYYKMRVYDGEGTFSKRIVDLVKQPESQQQKEEKQKEEIDSTVQAINDIVNRNKNINTDKMIEME